MGTIFILGLCLSHLSEFSALEHTFFHNKTTGETNFSVVLSNFIFIHVPDSINSVSVFRDWSPSLLQCRVLNERDPFNIKPRGGPTPGLGETGQLILAELILFA